MFWQKVDRLMAQCLRRGIVASAIFYVDGLLPGTDPFGEENAGCDPYKHTISVHGHGDFRFYGAAWCDDACYQSWDE